MTGELEPIYEDYSKGEQSTNREAYNAKYPILDPDETQSHSPMNQIET